MITRAPGIEDIFPERTDRWNGILSAARSAFSRFNYREIIIPVIEFTELFSRSIGSETDIVSKEMFTFEDRGGPALPSAPRIPRAQYAHTSKTGNTTDSQSANFSTSGRCSGRKNLRREASASLPARRRTFRERRSLHDAESIVLMQTITTAVGSAGAYDHTHQFYRRTGLPARITAALKKYYCPAGENSVPDCQRRLRNEYHAAPRLQGQRVQELRKGSPVISRNTSAPRARSTSVCQGPSFSSAGISVIEDPCLVRGLDYYTSTTFEFVTGRPWRQNAFAAGGRYDLLVESLGGKPTPAVGICRRD